MCQFEKKNGFEDESAFSAPKNVTKKKNKVMAFKVYIASHFLAKFEWPFVEKWKWKLSPQLHFWRNSGSRFKNVLNSTSNDLLLKNVKESYPPFPFHLHFWGNSASQVLKCKLCANSKKKTGVKWMKILEISIVSVIHF